MGTGRRTKERPGNQEDSAVRRLGRRPCCSPSSRPAHPAADAAGNGSGSCTRSGSARRPRAPTVASCSSKVLVNGKGAVPASTTPPRRPRRRPSSRTPTSSPAPAPAAGRSRSSTPTATRTSPPTSATYRSYFGLPACTTASGCLKIKDQNGGTNLPRFNTGWAGEQALDVDAVSAICPDCKILVVQAKSASIADLGTAVNTASKQAGVVAISNSYGGGDLVRRDVRRQLQPPGHRGDRLHR